MTRYRVIASRAGAPDMPHGTETFVIDDATDVADAIAQAQQRFTSDRQQVVDVKEV